MSALGRLVVSLGLDASQYVEGLTKAEFKAQKFSSTTSTTIAVAIAKAQIALNILGNIAGKVGDFTSKALDTAAGFQDMAEVTGAAAEALAGWQTAAAVSNTAMESIAAASVKLTKGLAGADEETKGAAQAIQALGFELEAFKQLKPEDQIEQIAFRLAEFEDGAGKTAFALAAMGRAGAAQLPFFKALAEQGGRQVVLTKEQIAAADAYKDKQAEVTSRIEQFAQVIAVDVLPVLIDFKKAFFEGGKALLGLDVEATKLGANRKVVDFAEDAALALGTLAETMVGLVRLGRAVGGSFQAVAADIVFMTKVASVAASGATAILKVGFLKDALDERNRIVEEANQRYVDLWNKSGTEITDAMRRNFSARRDFEGGAAPGETPGAFTTPPKRKRLSVDAFAAPDSGKDAAAARKALLDKQLSDLDNFIKAEQRLLDQRESALKRAYLADQLSIADYFDRRVAVLDEARARTAEAYAKQIAALEEFASKSAAAQKKIDAATTSKKKTGVEGATERAGAKVPADVAAARTKGTKEALEIETKIADIREKAAEADAKFEESRKDAFEERRRAAEDYADAVDEVRARVLELAGTEEGAAQAALIRFDRSKRDLLRRAAVEPGGERVAADVARLRDREESQARLNGLQERASIIQEQLAATEARIDLNRELGIQNEISAMIDLGRARGDAYQQLVTLADQYERVARAANEGLGDEKLIAQAKRFRIEVERLGASADVLGEKLGTVFGDAASGALEGFLNKTLSAKEAMRQFADEVIRQINRMAAQNIGDAIFGNLFKGAGAGGASGLESAANWFANAIGFTGWGLATGTDAVPHSMVAQVHAGETIIPANANRAITAAEQRGSDRLTPLTTFLSDGGFVPHDTLVKLHRGERVVTAHETRAAVAKARSVEPRAPKAPDASAVADVRQRTERIITTTYAPVGLPRVLHATAQHEQIVVPKALRAATVQPSRTPSVVTDPAVAVERRRPERRTAPVARQAVETAAAVELQAAKVGRAVALPRALSDVERHEQITPRPIVADVVVGEVARALPGLDVSRASTAQQQTTIDRSTTLREKYIRHTFDEARTLGRPTTDRPRTDFVPTTDRPPTDHRPTSHRPHTDFTPTSHRLRTDHAPTTDRLTTDREPTTFVVEAEQKALTFKAPRFDAPTFAARFDAPRFDAPVAPRFSAPSFAAPTFDAPRFDAPKSPLFTAPRFGVPEVAAPQVRVDAPSFAAPRFNAPIFDAPRFTAPSFAATFDAPSFAAPKFAAPEAPQFDAPTFVSPRYVAPRFAAPRAPTFSAPSFSATFDGPRFAAPRFDAPDSPSFFVQSLAAPTFKAGAAAAAVNIIGGAKVAATFDAPTFSAPTFSAPAAADVRFDAPRFSPPLIDVVAPDIAAQKVEVDAPSFSAPSFAAPIFAAPIIDLTAPSFEAHGVGVARTFSTPAAVDRPTYDRPLADLRPTTDRLATDLAPTVSRLATDLRPTAHRLPTDRVPTSRQRVTDRQRDRLGRFVAQSIKASFDVQKLDAVNVSPLIDIVAPTFAAPTFAAPIFNASAPSFAAPSFTAPRFNAPRFDAAKVSAERLQAGDAVTNIASPTFEAPRFSAPTFAVQRLVAPSAKAATFLAPTFDAPTFDAPVYAIPTAASPRAGLIAAGLIKAAERPAVTEAPSFAAPTFGAPRFDAPAFSAPTFAAPDTSALTVRLERDRPQPSLERERAARREAVERRVTERKVTLLEQQAARKAEAVAEREAAAVRFVQDVGAAPAVAHDRSEIVHTSASRLERERSFSRYVEMLIARAPEAAKALRAPTSQPLVDFTVSTPAIASAASGRVPSSRAVQDLVSQFSVKSSSSSTATTIFERAPQLVKAMEFILREQPHLANVIFSGRGFEVGGMPPIGKASWVGERGPELFVPKTAGTIVPNAALRSMGSGDISVNNTFVLPPGGVTRQTQNQIASRTFIAAQRAIQRGVAS